MPDDPNPLAELHRFILARYDLEEFRTLCFALGVAYDDLRGEGRQAKARELLLYLVRKRRLLSFFEQLQREHTEALAEIGLSTDTAALEVLYAEMSTYEAENNSLFSFGHKITSAIEISWWRILALLGALCVVVFIVLVVWPTDPQQTVWLCPESEFGGTACRTTRNTFPSNTVAVYASWKNRRALRQRLAFTRRWLKDGELILERTNNVGDNVRWTPSDGLSYYVYLSAVEGTGRIRFNSSTLPEGTYTFELLIDGELASTQDFYIE